MFNTQCAYNAFQPNQPTATPMDNYGHPDLHDEFDFTKTPIPLKQEYYQKIIKTNKGKNIVDKIMQVSLKNGKEKADETDSKTFSSTRRTKPHIFTGAVSLH